MHQPAPERVPTRTSAAIFRAKATLLQIQRAIQNWRQFIHRHPQVENELSAMMFAESATPLWTDPTPSEIWYQRGKIQNLRIAAARLHLCVIPAGAVFSFWQQVGRPSATKGFVPGRMLQEGCMIPAIGGGLCQLSNALYQVATDAGCEIIERHPHSRVVPGSATEARRDATVAWNYIDLRFRSSQPLQLRVRLNSESLTVALFAASQQNDNGISVPKPKPARLATLPILNDHACESCGQVSCFRSEHRVFQIAKSPVAAYLLDVAWPEFQLYVEANHKPTDHLAIPIDGVRGNRRQYGWPTQGFSALHSAKLTTLVRAWRTRRVAAQGAQRQRVLLKGAQALAKNFAKTLRPNVDEVCVSQSMLPFLWNMGVLGGRRVRVLGYQLPASAIQTDLDRAAAAHPESTTLRDFRADVWFIESEDEAFANAEQIITPHAALAALFPSRSLLVDWKLPPAAPAPPSIYANDSPTILFPGATLGRKGAYEVREALRGLDVRILLGGRPLEGEHFWAGFDTGDFQGGLGFEGIDIVLQPAIVGSRPVDLLRALAAGVPVITTPNSGLHGNCGAHFIPALDAPALRTAILNQIPAKPH
jgi:hypothetical protein